MPHEIIYHYLKNILKPQLAALNTPKDITLVALGTIDEQMHSCIHHYAEVQIPQTTTQQL